jgi:THAP domain
VSYLTRFLCRALKYLNFSVSRFPKNESRRAKWISAIENAFNYKVSLLANSCVCSLHFTTEQYEQGEHRTKLCSSAVPCVFETENKRREGIKSLLCTETLTKPIGSKYGPYQECFIDHKSNDNVEDESFEKVYAIEESDEIDLDEAEETENAGNDIKSVDNERSIATAVFNEEVITY